MRRSDRGAQSRSRRASSIAPCTRRRANASKGTPIDGRYRPAASMRPSTPTLMRSVISTCDGRRCASRWAIAFTRPTWLITSRSRSARLAEMVPSCALGSLQSGRRVDAASARGTSRRPGPPSGAMRRQRASPAAGTTGWTATAARGSPRTAAMQDRLPDGRVRVGRIRTVCRRRCRNRVAATSSWRKTRSASAWSRAPLTSRPSSFAGVAAGEDLHHRVGVHHGGGLERGDHHHAVGPGEHVDDVVRDAGPGVDQQEVQVDVQLRRGPSLSRSHCRGDSDVSSRRPELAGMIRIPCGPSTTMSVDGLVAGEQVARGDAAA